MALHNHYLPRGRCCARLITLIDVGPRGSTRRWNIRWLNFYRVTGIFTGTATQKMEKAESPAVYIGRVAPYGRALHFCLLKVAHAMLHNSHWDRSVLPWLGKCFMGWTTGSRWHFYRSNFVGNKNLSWSASNAKSPDFAPQALTTRKTLPWIISTVSG